MTWTRRIEDYAVVTLITLLIWLYAESRTLETHETTVTLELRQPAEDLVVVESSAPNVRVRFTGANSAISRLQSNLRGKLTVALPALSPGRQPLALGEYLPQAEQLADANVNITGIDPATVEVTIARMVTREAELAWKPDNITFQDGHKTDPPRVQIRLPEDRLPDVTTDGKVVLQLKPREDVNALRPNREHSLRADVLLPPALRGNPLVTVTPGEVRVSFIIEKKEESYTVPSVPVFVTDPPGERRHFEVTIHEEDQLLKDVQVTGPADLIALVRSGAIPIRATFWLDRDSLVSGAQKGESVFPIEFGDLPTSLSVVSPKNSVRVSIRRLGE